VSDKIHVATRKGLFTVERGTAGKWAVTADAFLGEPVTMVLHDRRDGALYAALNLGHFGPKLHRSDDSGESWNECTMPGLAGEDASVHQIWALEPGAADQSGTLWAGTIPGALFRSDDRAESWQLNRPLWELPDRERWFGGGYDQPGVHSICVDPRNADHITVGVSVGGVWHSRDGGEIWEGRTKGMYAVYVPPENREDPAQQDPHRLVQSPTDPDVMWVQHHNGVFKSVDGAASWNDVTNVPASTFGFAVAIHPGDAETVWLVPAVKDECRIPVDGKLFVARTRDGGASFDALTEGLPQERAYDLVFRHALDVDPAGERLALGSTTGNLWISENGGDRWESVSTHLPPIYQVRFA